MYKYCGPEGFGCAPESGGDKDIGQYRMQSLDSFKQRLNASAREIITEVFKKYGLEVKKIEKLQPSCRLRIAYNGEAWKLDETRFPKHNKGK